MLVCQWHLDIVYGKQADAVRVVVPGSQYWIIYPIEILPIVSPGHVPTT